MPVLDRALIVRLAIALLVVVALAIGGTMAWQAWHGRAAQTKVDRGQADAGAAAGIEALNIQQEAVRQRAAIDITVREATHAIETAPAGNSNDAADRALCGMRSYRDDAGCAALRGTGGGERPAE